MYCYAPMDGSLKVDLRVENGVTKLMLAGAITEQTHLSELTPKLGPVIELGLEGVERINSAGVREWVSFMRQLRSNGAQCVLDRCPPSIIAQFSMILDFGCGARVRSVLAPFACESCAEEHLQLMDADDSLASKLERELPCPRCGKPMQFDDLPEHFLAFRKAG
jgi:anti-anti-sigma regulatory factor